MASNNSENNFHNTGSVSDMRTTLNPTSISLIITSFHESPRRSVRLSSKTSRSSLRSSHQTNIHRTISGGVPGIHSPKLNAHHANSLGARLHGNSNDVSKIILNDDMNVANENNDVIMSNFNLVSDQSDDEEMQFQNKNKADQRNLSGTVSRTEILSYFEEQTDGYKCKICNKVEYFNFF